MGNSQAFPALHQFGSGMINQQLLLPKRFNRYCPAFSGNHLSFSSAGGEFLPPAACL